MFEFDFLKIEIDIATLVVIFAVAATILLQIFVCQKAKRQIVRSIPLIICIILAIICAVLGACIGGWNGFGYLFFAILFACLAVVCCFVRGILAILKREK